MGAAPFLHMLILAVMRIFGVVIARIGNKWTILAQSILDVLRIFWVVHSEWAKIMGLPPPRH